MWNAGKWEEWNAGGESGGVMKSLWEGIGEGIGGMGGDSQFSWRGSECGSAGIDSSDGEAGSIRIDATMIMVRDGKSEEEEGS